MSNKKRIKTVVQELDPETVRNFAGNYLSSLIHKVSETVLNTSRIARNQGQESVNAHDSYFNYLRDNLNAVGLWDKKYDALYKRAKKGENVLAEAIKIL